MGKPKDTTVSKNDPNVTTKGMPKGTMVYRNHPNVTTMGMPKDAMVSKNDPNVTTKGIPNGTMVSKIQKGTIVSRKQTKSYHEGHAKRHLGLQKLLNKGHAKRYHGLQKNTPKVITMGKQKGLMVSEKQP